MKTKISVREAVTRAIKAHGPMTPKELTKTTGRASSRVYTAISMMKQNGYLTRLGNGQYAIADAPALTAITPNIEPVKTLPSKPEISFAKQLGRAQAEIDNLQKKLQDITIKYYDNLAVLRYLESKLTISKRT
jgi:hypothetical protein